VCAQPRLLALFVCALLCASELGVWPVEAQVGAGGAAASNAEEQLTAILRALEHAHFDDANTLARALLASPTLSARQRNDALELLAVSQIAAREESTARATLDELFTRDPEHAERLRDPGPSVSASFARARGESRTALQPVVRVALVRDALGRALLEVRLDTGRDAVDSVHVFVRTPLDIPTTHLVADVGTRSRLTFALPAYPSAASARTVELHVEARAPSGALLAQAGSAQAPLVLALTSPLMPCAASAPAPPLRHAWWLWTSIAIVVAGIGVSGAIVAN